LNYKSQKLAAETKDNDDQVCWNVRSLQENVARTQIARLLGEIWIADDGVEQQINPTQSDTQ
jgi:hypothetical protein